MMLPDLVHFGMAPALPPSRARRMEPHQHWLVVSTPSSTRVGVWIYSPDVVHAFAPAHDHPHFDPDSPSGFTYAPQNLETGFSAGSDAAKDPQFVRYGFSIERGSASYSPRIKESRYSGSAEASADTQLRARDHSLDDSIRALFCPAYGYHFEDGCDSPLSNGIVSAVRRHGSSAMEVISYLVSYRRASAEVASEALRTLGRLRDPGTHNYRRWLLERSLTDPDVYIRDAAFLGLDSMKDQHSSSALKAAADVETVSWLREMMMELAASLESM